uniref:Uncharacterized protein n=1 Tax=Acrobeloides nanus TaxID=290746 RepID=A0A914CYC7_9BILA
MSCLVKEQSVKEWSKNDLSVCSHTHHTHPPRPPTDYHINRSLKNWMSNKVYDDFDELVDDVKAWIASKNRGFFERGIDMLPEKWEAVIEVDGEYAPE